MYNQILFTNILRILNDWKMTKIELSKRAGVSISFLSDLTNGKANPSLKVMKAIADALETPLPVLLQSPDHECGMLAAVASNTAVRSVPQGYEHVSVVLPSHKAYIVKRWGDDARKKLQKKY